LKNEQANQQRSQIKIIDRVTWVTDTSLLAITKTAHWVVFRLGGGLQSVPETSSYWIKHCPATQIYYM